MPTAGRLLPFLDAPASSTALIAGGRELDYGGVAAISGQLAEQLAAGSRVAVWSAPTLETCVAVVAALSAGATIVPINPGAGAAELEHMLADSQPELVLAPAGAELPPTLASRPRLAVTLEPSPSASRGRSHPSTRRPWSSTPPEPPALPRGS
jgi:malonyl-CoA/methylmalonyl-CoA synthetase